MSPAEAQKSIAIAFHRVTPILRVNDLDASLTYYVGVLGFKMDWRDDDGNSFASLSRGHCQLFLSVGDQGNPGSWMWIGVSDVDALHEELLGKGARYAIRLPTIPGARANSISKTRTAMCFVWAPKTSPASRLATGSICAVFAGGLDRRAAGLESSRLRPPVTTACYGLSPRFTGLLPLTQSFHPPKRAFEFLTPRLLSRSTARALVASSCQAQ